MALYFSTPAIMSTSHSYQEIKRLYPDEIVEHGGYQAIMHMKVVQAFIEFGGPRNKYRPRIVLHGYPIKFVGDFPCNITECRLFNRSDQKGITYDYELTRKNIADMANKGLFEKGFRVPNIIRNNVLELPCICEITTVAPPAIDNLEEEPEPMLVCIRPQDGSKDGEVNSFVCFDDDKEIDGRKVPGSGYVISDYFEYMPESGYEINETPEAMDILEMTVASRTEQAKKVIKTTSEKVNSHAYADDDLFDDYDKQSDTTEVEKVDELSSAVINGNEVDDETLIMFNKMRRDILAILDDRDRHRKNAEIIAARIGQKLDDDNSDLDKNDELFNDDLFKDGTTENNVEDVTATNVKRDRVSDINKVENIDTPEELADELDTVDPANAALIDTDALPKHMRGKRPVPDISSIIDNHAVEDLFEK